MDIVATGDVRSTVHRSPLTAHHSRLTSKRVLLLLPTTTYRTQAFMDAAVQLGVHVTVGSEEGSTLTPLNPGGLLTLNFNDPTQAACDVLQFAARHPIDAVVPVDDQVTVVAAAICQALGLRHNSLEAATAARNKYYMRDLLRQAGVPQPQYRLLSLADDLSREQSQVDYPCVVKPLTLAGSRGVIRADNKADFVRAVERLAAILHSQDEGPGAESGEPIRRQHSSQLARPQPSASGSQGEQFLVEEFIRGEEVALEGLLSRGTLRVLALFDKPDPLEGPFFAETIYVTPSRLPLAVQRQIARCAEQACQALGLTEGPVHVELRLDANTARYSPLTTDQPQNPRVIEVNPRSIGGLCSRVLRFGTGISLEELIIRHALEPEYVAPARDDRPAGVMMIPAPRAGVLHEVRGLCAARGVTNIEQVTVSAHLGQRLIPLPESSQYLGFIFARAGSPEAVEAALRESYAQVEFVIRPFAE